MDIKEINNMSMEEERQHWWIQTRFLYIDKIVTKLLTRKNQLKIIEFGCGTCQNLWYLRTQSPLSHLIAKLVGVDPNLPENFQAAWKTPDDQIKQELKSEERSDIILAMDVLEHINDDQKALTEWVQHLDEKGLILITVPAFNSLWSRHDELLDHKRRYTKDELLDVAKRSGLEPVSLSYAFSFIFPVVYLIRKILPESKKQNSTDLKLPHPIINNILISLGKIEAMLGGTPVFGTSVIGIFKRARD